MIVKNEIRVSVFVPPHQERHVAEISLYSDKSPPEGYDATSHPIGEVKIENGDMEFEIYMTEQSGSRTCNCKELIDALNEGMNRLVELYPQLI